MLNNDDVPRGVSPQPGRRPAPTRFQDPRFSSPSSNYNYNSSAGYNQSNGFGGLQHPRRKIDRFKREQPVNYNDRIIRQNDSIIRLLKEIRDRLPAPPASAVAASDQETVIHGVSSNAAGPETNESTVEGMDQGFDPGPGTESDQSFEGQVERPTE